MKKQNLLFKALTLVFMMLLIQVSSIQAQDLIIKKDNSTIKAKILEIGTSEIKYKLYDSPDGPTITIPKREVKSMKIKSADGKTDKVMSVNEDPMSVGNGAIVDKTSSIKFHFFSPLTKKMAFTYEWMVKPGFNWEAGIGIVGPGTSLANNFVNLHPRGFYLRTGPKFLLGSSSDIEIEGARYAHPLKGRYFKVEALFYTLNKDYDVTDYDTSNVAHTINVKSSYNGIALHLIYGRQYIFGNSITVGWYTGIGYGMESRSVNYATPLTTLISDFDPIRHSHTYMGDKFPLTFTAGFNIGYIFRTPDWLSSIGKPKHSNRPPNRNSMD